MWRILLYYNPNLIQNGVYTFLEDMAVTPIQVQEQRDEECHDLGNQLFACGCHDDCPKSVECLAPASFSLPSYNLFPAPLHTFSRPPER